MKPNLKILLFLTAVALQVTAFGQTPTQVEAFDRYVEQARTTWNVPGLSVAIVKDGKVVLARGYGVRELGKTGPVTADTLFGAMSTTKAMTVAAMAMLVDEGKLKWDDKVTKHLPEFRVGDPYVTNELRVRDLLTHSGGLGNADFLWAWTPELSSAEIVHKMRLAQPAYSLRSSFVYQNVMYLVAGQVIEKASGMPWEKFVTERLFGPLGMRNSFATWQAGKSYQDRSAAHFDVKGKIEVIPDMTIDTIAPAGSVWSTADDIAKWVAFMLGDGTWNGKTLIKPATFNEILKPQVIVPGPEFYPTIAITKPHWMTYGLGWFQHDYRGEMVNFHTGSIDGRTAIVGLLRDKKTGVYIFGNLDHAEVRHALMYKAFDVFGFGDEGRDWSAEFKTLYDGIKSQRAKAEESFRAKRAQNTQPSLPLTAYAGRYSDPFYGSVDVVADGGKLRAKVGGTLTADLGHWQFDTFIAAWNKKWWDESLVSFQLSPVGAEVASLSLDGVTLRREPNAAR